MNIGSKITTARQQCGMTQSELADKMCVTRQTVSRWEAGTAFPDVEKVAHIAKLLGVSCDYLLDDSYEAEGLMEIKEGKKTRQPEENNCITELLKSLVGKKVHIDFYEDEGEVDLFFDNAAVLIAVDEKWALLEISDKGKKKQKLIRLSSIKGVSTKK